MLFRSREFTMAEIEHFCDPTSKSHPKFASVKDVKLTLFSACDQMDGKKPTPITIGEAVGKVRETTASSMHAVLWFLTLIGTYFFQGLVANETLGYFLVRIQQFLHNTGVDQQKLRFRQHMGNEMAHYACDCWDAEILTSYVRI